MKKEIYWTPHADDRYRLRFALLDIMRDEIEQGIERQEFKIPQGYDSFYHSAKFKTIFPVRNTFATVEKGEKEERIVIITLWESSEEEIEQWKKRK